MAVREQPGGDRRIVGALADGKRPGDIRGQQRVVDAALACPFQHLGGKVDAVDIVAAVLQQRQRRQAGAAAHVQDARLLRRHARAQGLGDEFRGLVAEPGDHRRLVGSGPYPVEPADGALPGGAYRAVDLLDGRLLQRILGLSGCIHDGFPPTANRSRWQLSPGGKREFRRRLARRQRTLAAGCAWPVGALREGTVADAVRGPRQAGKDGSAPALSLEDSVGGAASLSCWRSWWRGGLKQRSRNMLSRF